jgi:hypothetical protein
MNRYTTSAMPARSPIQFSALKALNPLHQEPEKAEDHDREYDDDQIGHIALLGARL